MMEKDNTFDRVKKTAGGMVRQMNKAVHNASEWLAEQQEAQRLATQLRDLRKEREQCRQGIADLVIRMFDEGAFVEMLLRPEYRRIKTLEAEIARLEAARSALPAEATTAPALENGTELTPMLIEAIPEDGPPPLSVYAEEAAIEMPAQATPPAPMSQPAEEAALEPLAPLDTVADLSAYPEPPAHPFTLPEGREAAAEPAEEEAIKPPQP